MAIRLGSNAFTSEKLTSKDLNDTFGVLGNNLYILGNLHLTLLYQSVNSTTQNFKGDVYTDANGWLNTIDTPNTTALFYSNYYASLEIVYSNPSEVTTTSTSYVVVKTFNVDKKIYYITSKIRHAHDAYVVSLKVRFTDVEGSWETEEVSSTGKSNVSVIRFNPQPERIPTTVEIMLKSSNSNYEAKERNTMLFGAPATPVIVQTNPQSIQSGFQNFVIIANEETSGTSSVTYDVSFDGGTNYQTGLVSSQIYEIENPGTSLILKQNLNPGENADLAKTYDWGILLL